MKKSSVKIPSKKIVVIYHGKMPGRVWRRVGRVKKFGAKAAYFAARDRSAPPVPLKIRSSILLTTHYDAPIIKKTHQRQRSGDGDRPSREPEGSHDAYGKNIHMTRSIPARRLRGNISIR